jgi:hypothetical protein
MAPHTTRWSRNSEKAWQKSISGLKWPNISSTVLDFYFKFVPDIHFPVQDTDKKFQTVSQKNQGVTSD